MLTLHNSRRECSSDWPATDWRCCSWETATEPQVANPNPQGPGLAALATPPEPPAHPLAAIAVSSAITIRDIHSLADRLLSCGSSKLSDDNPLPIHGAAPRRAAGLLRILPDRSRRTVRSKHCIQQPTPAIRRESPSARR